MAANLDALIRAIKGEAEQVERAVKGKNRRLISKYRKNLEVSLQSLYKELSCAKLDDAEREQINAQCNDAEKLARDSIFLADECEALLLENEEATNTAKVADAEMDVFRMKLKALLQIFEKSPDILIKDVDDQNKFNIIKENIRNVDSMYAELGTSYVRVCQCVVDKQSKSMGELNEEYGKVQSAYVSWIEQAHRVKGAQCIPKVAEIPEKKCELKIQPLELPVFKGEPRDYARFRREFIDTVERRFSDSQVRCLYLQNQCLKGPAKELVRGLNTYTAVLDRLDKRYGQSSVIVGEVLRDLENLKVSGEGEQKSILKICKFLQSAWDDLEAVNSLNEFCNVVTLNTLEGKLMAATQVKWATEKSKLEEALSSAQVMVKLKEFLDKERQIAENVMAMQGKLEGLVHDGEPSGKEKGKGFHEPSGKEKGKGFQKFTGHVNEVGDGQLKGKQVKGCYRCGRPGHMVRDCKVPRSIKCHQCGEHGHMKFACQKGEGKDEIKDVSADDKKVRFKDNEGKATDNKVGLMIANTGNSSLDVRLPVEVVCTEFGSCNTLWDSGSTLNLVSKHWVKKNNLVGKKCRLQFRVVDGTTHDVDSRLYTMSLKARDGTRLVVRAYELDSIASPIIPMNVSRVASFLSGVGVEVQEEEIANPCGEVDLLLGGDCLSVFPKSETVVRNLCVMASDFGVHKYFVAGSHDSLGAAGMTERVHSVCFSKSISISPLDDICSEAVNTMDTNRKKSMLLDFWSLEGLGVKPPPICSNCKNCRFCSSEAQQLTLKEAQELDVIRYNLTYVAEKERWTTSYPFTRDPAVLRNNYYDALKALERRERKLMADKEIADLYDGQVKDFTSRGVLRKLNRNEIDAWTGPVRYVDHRHVIKSGSTTPVRLVINSSFAHKGEPSLNSILMKGPKLLNCIFDILARWRMWPVAFVGDITKMYHNVSTGELEGHVRRLLWREYDTSRSPDVYVFQTVTFGDRPAGCIVMSALRRTAEMFRSVDEKAAEMIIRDSYMDDVVSGTLDKEEAIEAIENIQQIAGKGGFKFKKFTTSWTLDEPDFEESVLGIRWKVSDDTVSASMKVSNFPSEFKGKWTKRQCWKYTSSFFDPLGFFVAITVRLKILMKNMFVGSLKYKAWDTKLEEADQKKWDDVAADVERLDQVWLKRSCIPCKMTAQGRCWLVGFCDASQDALCAVIYCRYDNGCGDIGIYFFAAKTRVTPAKRETMPRLELCGALLLSRLMVKCRSCLTMSLVQEYFLSDSKIVLGQLANTDRLMNDFVGIRVLEIRANSAEGLWAYVPSENNVADLGSRGVDSRSLPDCWFEGPSWLMDSVSSWPVEVFQFSSINNGVFQVTEEKPVIDASRFSRLGKLHRVTAVCFLFLGSKGNGKTQIRSAEERVKIPVEYIKKAESYWLRKVNENTVRLFHSGKLSSLRPSLVWSAEGNYAQVVTSGRVGSFLKIGYDVEELPILDHSHPYVRLVLRDYHEREHAGDDKVLWQVGSRFWIPQARKVIRGIRKSCIKCRIICRKLAGQIMAPLPNERVLPCPPWTNTGVDLFGPFECRDHIKKRMKVKVWGVIFTCLVTRAVHLDVTSAYGTDAVLQALRRFISLRGCPRQMFSDHGSQLVGCSKEVKFFKELVNWDLVEGWCTSEGISWKLFPPQGQHMNGCAESLIRITKKVLYQRLEGIVLTFEELLTVLYEVGNIINSRPLSLYTKPGDDPLDGGPVTPNHLLLGRATSKIPEFRFENVSITRRVKFLQELVRQFWMKWHVMVFPSLVPQYKWRVQERDVCEGDVVLLRDEAASPGDYKLGQVAGVKVSADGHVRSVTVRYVKSSDNGAVHGYVCRPVHKLVVILPVEDQ